MSEVTEGDLRGLEESIDDLGSELHDKFDKLEEKVDDLKSDFDTLSDEYDCLDTLVHQIKDDLLKLYERVAKLEIKQKINETN